MVQRLAQFLFDEFAFIFHGYKLVTLQGSACSCIYTYNNLEI